MAIGDIWRVDASGIVEGFFGVGLATTWKWVNVWYLQVTAGVGMAAAEAVDAISVVEGYYTSSRDSDLFGSGMRLKRIRAVRQRDGRELITVFDTRLGDPGVRSVPNGSAVLLTGRADALGRRTERYIACVSINYLQDGGQLVANGGPMGFIDWMRSGSGLIFTLRPVIFDRAGILPTLFVSRARISPGWRSQRRRSTGVENEVVTVYNPVN